MSLFDLICPTVCEGCGAPGAAVCTRCAAVLGAQPRRHRPTPCPQGLPPLWSAAAYEGAVRDLILGFKERGAVELGRVLAEPLARGTLLASAGGSSALLLVPAASSKAAIRERGDDVMALLAARAARVLRRHGVAARAVSALAQRRVVADSAGLSAAHRAENLRGALVVRPGRGGLLAGSSVVLVDDLVTTGATLNESSRVLQAAGATVLGAATIAATQRRNVSFASSQR
jgi:predicted amidophosphoribosyltransferase